MEKKVNHTAYIMIVLGLLVNLCLGAVYSYSVFRIPLEQTLNAPTAVSGYPYMVFLTMFALTMPFAGFLLERIGPRSTALIGGVLVASGWFLAGFSTSINQITVFYGVLGGIGVGISYGVPLSLAARWFPQRPGLAAGITLMGFGMSPFITAPLAGLIIEQYGVLSAFRSMGLGFAAIIAVCALPMHLPQAAAAGNHQREGIAAKAMLKSPQFWGLWFCFTLGTIVGLTAIGITSPVAQSTVGLTSGAAATAVSLMAVFNGIGRPFFGSLTDKFGIRRAAQSAFALIVLASLLMLSIYHIPAALALLRVSLFGISFSLLWMVLGGWLAIAPAATNQLFGRRYYSRNYGFVYTAYGAGAIIGTVSAGAMYELFGGFQMVFAVLLTAGALGLLVSVRLLPGRST